MIDFSKLADPLKRDWYLCENGADRRDLKEEWNVIFFMKRHFFFLFFYSDIPVNKECFLEKTEGGKQPIILTPYDVCLL